MKQSITCTPECPPVSPQPSGSAFDLKYLEPIHPSSFILHNSVKTPEISLFTL
jgi:hypothetical protein